MWHLHTENIHNMFILYSRLAYILIINEINIRFFYTFCG